MYTYISSIGKNLTNNNIWEEFDINEYLLKDLPKTYSDAYITVHNPFSKKNEVLLLSSIQSKIASVSLTFSQWLETIGNTALPTIGSSVTLKRKTVKRQDLVKAEWKMKPVTKLGSPHSNDDALERDWIFIEKEGVKPEEAFKYCMVSVNGFYHRLDGSKQGVWIADGMNTVKRSQDNHLSILSFKDVGALEYVDITEEMIYKQNEEATLYDQCFINLPKPTENKTLILVIMGYIHILDWISFRRVGEKQIKIDFKNIPLIKRIHEASQYLNLESLNLQNDVDETFGALSLDQVRSDDFIKALLKLPQSFVVYLDNNEVYTEKHNLMTLPAPGRYISHIEPHYPMVVGYGMAGEYWSVKDHDEWAISLRVAPYGRKRYAQVDINQVNNVNQANDPIHRTEFSKAHLLEIGTLTTEVTK